MMKKKLYITTAIPYANGAPHIGNALDYLIADIWARYQRQQGNEVRFQVGTDEYGNKIAEKAAENGSKFQKFNGQNENNLHGFYPNDRFASRWSFTVYLDETSALYL